MELWLLKNWKLIAAAVLAAGLSFATWRVTAAVYRGKIAEIYAAQAKAETLAEKLKGTLERGQEAVNAVAAARQGVVQIKVIKETHTVIEEVTRYVTEVRGCITVGFIRVLDAEILGERPSQLPDIPGKPDDACAPLTNADVAKYIIRNYGEANANAAQLDGLNETIRAKAAEYERAVAAFRR